MFIPLPYSFLAYFRVILVRGGRIGRVREVPLLVGAVIVDDEGVVVILGPEHDKLS